MGSKCPSGTGCSNIMADVRFYPKGAAKAHFTAHNAKDPKETARCVETSVRLRAAGGLIGLMHATRRASIPARSSCTRPWEGLSWSSRPGQALWEW